MAEIITENFETEIRRKVVRSNFKIEEVSNYFIFLMVQITELYIFEIK